MAEQEPVYLCQVRERLSCGACCGLYNVADPRRDYLFPEFLRRTEEFADLPRTEDAIDAFSRRTLDRQNVLRRPYKEFFHCPFLGLMGEGRDRTGCLLHPLAAGNEGRDLRGYSWYGSMACRTYFCPSHKELPGRYARLVQAACDDWHLYGLCITETAMLKCFFGLTEKLMGKEIDPARACADPEAGRATHAFLSQKLAWPFRMPGENRLADYFFNDGLYPRPRIPYTSLGVPVSELDPILSALCSHLPGPETLEEASARILSLAEALAAALSR